MRLKEAQDVLLEPSEVCLLIPRNPRGLVGGVGEGSSVDYIRGGLRLALGGWDPGVPPMSWVQSPPWAGPSATCSGSLSSATMAALVQSMTSEKGSSQRGLSSTGMQPA